ncbi:MAG: hypothetical protein ABFS32_05040 [Bacteroidota bacterium]
MARSLTVLFIFFATSSFAQNIWVADNNYNAPTGDHVFASLQDAINAASAGDIVQVQPSPNSYGNVSIADSITLIGIGFNVDKDMPLKSIVGNISLTNNIENTKNASGTVVKGIEFSQFLLASNTGPAYTLKNILIKNCQFSYIRIVDSPVDNLEIRNCYIHGNYSGYALYAPRKLSSLLCRNNLILYNMAFSSTIAGDNNFIANNILYGGIYINAEGSLTYIINNNFIGQKDSETSFDTELKDCIISNNIFYGSTPSIGITGSTSPEFQRNIFNNNIVHSTGDDTMPPTGGEAGNSGSNNLIVSPDFEYVQLLNSWSSDYNFTLKAGSPALNAGDDGTDIGISGGAYAITEPNFSLKTTKAPVIQILNTSTVINPGDSLPVRIKAKSN